MQAALAAALAAACLLLAAVATAVLAYRLDSFRAVVAGEWVMFFSFAAGNAFPGRYRTGCRQPGRNRRAACRRNRAVTSHEPVTSGDAAAPRPGGPRRGAQPTGG